MKWYKWIDLNIKKEYIFNYAYIEQDRKYGSNFRRYEI